MVSLIFKIFCWQQGCRPSMVLFFIALTIFLFFLLLLLIVFHILEYNFCYKKINLLLHKQKEYFANTLPLVQSGKISIFSINSIKTPLTSLRLIIDKLKDPSLVKDRVTYKKYLQIVDSLLLKIKVREELLNKQLVNDEEPKLFDLIKEIKQLLAVYEEIILLNNIDCQLISDREYRLFADQNHLLRIINIILLNMLESLIISDQDHRQIKIYFKKSPYLLKIFLSDNLGLIKNREINAGLKSNIHKKEDCYRTSLCIHCADRLMNKYFHKSMKIKNLYNKETTYCLRIKNSYILAEPRIK